MKSLCVCVLYLRLRFVVSQVEVQVHESIPHRSWLFLPLFSLKLSQLRGNEKKFTLLHALVEQIMLHEPRLATFFQELTEFETVPGGRLIKIAAKWKIGLWLLELVLLNAFLIVFLCALFH